MQTSGQLTLSKLIEILSAMPPNTRAPNLEYPNSCRGHLDHLAFELGSDFRLAEGLLMDCKEAAGSRFALPWDTSGFIAQLSTPLWIAEYGRVGRRPVGFSDRGVETEE